MASEEVTLHYVNILKSNGILDPVSEVIVGDSGLKGENLGGLTNYVTVKFKEPGKEPLHLFEKKKTDNVMYNQMMDDLELYQIEAMFLLDYLPVAREYCKSVGQEELMNIYPKCHYGDANTIVLENLVVEKGFILLKKEELQDFETAKWSLSTLAKHHAISHAVIQKLGGYQAFSQRFPKLEMGMSPKKEEAGRAMMEPLFESGIDTNLKLLEKCQGDLNDIAMAMHMLKSKKGKVYNDVMGQIKVTEKDFLVLVHGDYWNNNMMFLKDKETNKILDHITIDFQAVKLGSQCQDLAYYFFTSVKQPVRRKRFGELLQVYLDVLRKTGDDLGYPINITLEQLEFDYCKRFHLGYWVGMALTTGPGYEVMKDFEIGADQDMDQMSDAWDALVDKWIEEHPEECKVKAQNVIDYVKDYQKLSRGIIG